MRTASAFPAAYTVNCPHCGAALSDPGTGSFLLGLDSVDALRRHTEALGRAPDTASCFACTTVYRLPRALLRLAP